MRVYEYSYRDEDGIRVMGVMAAQTDHDAARVIRRECPEARGLLVRRMRDLSVDRQGRIVKKRRRSGA